MRRALLAAGFLALLPSFAIAGGKAGVGSGLPYGTPLLGAGVELELGKYFGVLGGVGVGNYDAPWSCGVRLSFLPPDRSWRPHVSVLKWTEGYGVYGGVDHDLGKPGGFVMTYGVGYGDVNQEAKVGVLIGVGYRFKLR